MILQLTSSLRSLIFGFRDLLNPRLLKTGAAEELPVKERQRPRRDIAVARGAVVRATRAVAVRAMRCEIDSAGCGVCRCAGGEEGGFGVAHDNDSYPDNVGCQDGTNKK